MKTCGDFPSSYVVRYSPRVLEISRSNNSKVTQIGENKKLLNRLPDRKGKGRHVTKISAGCPSNLDSGVLYSHFGI